MNIEDIIQLNNGVHIFQSFEVIKDQDVAEIIFDSSKTAGVSRLHILDIPVAPSCSYSDGALLKLASSADDGIPSEKVQGIINKLADTQQSLPDVYSLRKLLTLCGAMEPSSISLKVSQWGGHGNTQDSGRNSGGVNSFFPIGISFDSILDSARGDQDDWNTNVEKRLSKQHRTQEEDNAQYDLSWDERIRGKNLKRLRDILKNRKEQKENEEKRKPEYIRCDDEDINVVGYMSPEERLNNKRDTKDEDYGVRRVEERVPDWYSRIRTYRHSENEQMSKVSQTIGTGSGLDPFSYTPNRRNTSDPAEQTQSRGSNFLKATDPAFATWGDEENGLFAMLRKKVSDYMDSADEIEKDPEYISGPYNPYNTPKLLSNFYAKRNIPDFEPPFQAITGAPGGEMDAIDQALANVLHNEGLKDLSVSELHEKLREVAKQLIGKDGNLNQRLESRRNHTNDKDETYTARDPDKDEEYKPARDTAMDTSFKK